MRFLTTCTLALLLAGANVASGGFEFSIAYDPAINATPTGGTFTVRMTANVNTTFDTYSIKINATQFGNGISTPLTFTESNLIPGWFTLDFNSSNTIGALNDTGLTHTVGFSAFGTAQAVLANQSINVAQFGFTVANNDFSAAGNHFWDAGFVVGNMTDDTFVALQGESVAITTTGARIAAVPEPSSLALLSTVLAGLPFVRRRRMTVSV